MNDQSSRSHSVFRLVVESKRKPEPEARRLSDEDVDGAVLVASLNLVDLAGSESIRHTGADGIRQREAGNINKSLLTLARVINALASNGGQNAPFRDSKLTRLLQNSLGGNTRTLIICCVTPSDRYIEETKSTLQFAARAKDVRTTATVNEVLDDQTQLRRLKREVRELKKLVNSEALDALKAENEALLSEKKDSKSEMARLKGLILSSTSVAKAAAEKKRSQRGKRMRETWGPGDFPSSVNAPAPASPHLYPRKRHSPAKENMDPQTIFHIHEDADESVTNEDENPVIDYPRNKLKPNHSDHVMREGSKEILDLFSAVLRNYRDENIGDPIAAGEAAANKKSSMLSDSERDHALDVLADIKSLMVANVDAKADLNEKLMLEQEVKELRAKVSEVGSGESRTSSDCSENADERGEDITSQLASALEALEKEKRHCQELETELTNSRQMAAEELNCLYSQLEASKLESDRSQQQFTGENHRLKATLESLHSGQSPSADEEGGSLLRSQMNMLENQLKEVKASQTVLQLAIAERDEEIASLQLKQNNGNRSEQESLVKSLKEEKALLKQKICELEQQVASISMNSSADGGKQSENAITEELAGQIQDIMAELAQLQSDHEEAALEKQELQAEYDGVSRELEISQRQGYELSETLIQKEHIAKVLQAQLDAKLMTISQMQTKHTGEVESLQQAIQSYATEKEQLLATIEDLWSALSTSTDTTSSRYIADGGTNEIHSDEKQAVGVGAQNLHVEVDELSRKLSLVESELAATKERLQESERSADQSEIKVAFDKLQADFDSLQQESRTLPDLHAEKEQVDAAPSTSDEHAMQQRSDTLNEDYTQLENDLEKVSRERDECVEELRTLESQLMEVSEEKMKLTITVDEQGAKLREVQQVVSSSTDTIAALQTQLQQVQSAKVALETTKAELEHNMQSVQVALEDLQAEHAATMAQMERHDTSANSNSENNVWKVEHLQQRLESESKQRHKLELDVQSYEETLSVLRQEAKDSSDKIADMLEQMKRLETDLDSASRARESKEMELASLADALARSKEEQQEMRLQGKQRLVAAESKELALEEKISALQQQLMTDPNDVNMSAILMHNATQTELIESREAQTELQTKVVSLEDQLSEAREELRKQDDVWNKKQAMAEKEFARLMAEQKRLQGELATIQSSAGGSKEEMDAQAEELQKTKQAYAELFQQKEAIQHELETASATWEEKQQELLCQMDTIREQFQQARNEIEDYQKNADNEIIRLRSVIQDANAEIEEVKRSAQAREEELRSQIGEQDDWQRQFKNRHEDLQATCDELDHERQQLKERYAALESERGDLEEQLRSEILELSQKYTSAQAQQNIYQSKLKEIETQLEMTENDAGKYRRELESLAESLKSSQVEAVQYHNQLVEVQLAKESMEKLIEKQKARIDKLEKVKMTTETLDLFRKLKKDRHDLQVKVQDLQKDLAQAEKVLTESQTNYQETEQRLVENKEEELNRMKEHVQELRDALRAETQRAADVKTEMRAVLSDEREKAEHEVQEMQALLKEKMELVEKLEVQLASVQDAMVTLREQKSENVSYLEKENLDLHVENRELKKRLESALSPPQNEDLMGDTGTYDASAAAAAKALGEDNTSAHEKYDTHVISDRDDTNDAASQPQPEGTSRAGGFLLSMTELDAIAAQSQEEPKDVEQPECSQQ
ncbi:unnamed protein product [Phytophthora fragariaefolia]|uniref:Unnamed protein product n=1 Tax=Phytophthora fragariaefolia TaxID=1490495 RepID=A0A9W7CQ71_9STRA|nr:unnamed protein product [Phytophthora fragariaefolia]